VIGAGLFFFERFTSSRQSAKTPEKSIAVLPFENLSKEKPTLNFADGIQDEI
jgi:TolB-like protein